MEEQWGSSWWQSPNGSRAEDPDEEDNQEAYAIHEDSHAIDFFFIQINHLTPSSRQVKLVIQMMTRIFNQTK